MSLRFALSAALALMLAFTASVIGGETGHYVNGVEGLKCGSVPPPGVYLRNYLVYYHAGQYMDKNGHDANLDFNLDITAAVSRLIWITPKKILGADYGMQLVASAQSTDLKNRAAGIEDEDAGVCDLDVSPLILSWHKPRFDLSLAYEVFLPTGEQSTDQPADPGKDFYSHMFTLGGTYYFDANRTWHASLLSRYEIHSEKDDTEVRPGNDFHFEWGIGRTLAKQWDVGVSGYCHWQITDDKGSDVNWDANTHDRVFAIGPEVSYFHTPTKVQVGLRGLWEFGARDRQEGGILSMTIMKVF